MIIFLRHGQAQNNVERRLVGRLPNVPLTGEGIRQAQDAARYLEQMNISRIYSSPMQRAHQTAQIVAGAGSREVAVDERLTEIDMGNFTGMKYGELAYNMGDVFLRFYKGDAIFNEMGVESFESVQGRVQNMVDYIIRKHPGENVVLVTHMDPIKAILASVVRMPMDVLCEVIIANASLNIFHQDKDRLYLGAVNVMSPNRFGQRW